MTPPAPSAVEQQTGKRRRPRWLLLGVGVVVLIGAPISLNLLKSDGRAPVPQVATISPNNSPEWKLVWQSDFDRDVLDSTHWRALDWSTYGDGNLELACLTARPENIRVQDGQLSLIAQREDPPLQCGSSDARFPAGRDYSSAMVSTQGLASWTSGVLEVRARMPLAPGTSQGLWPAIWMRPDDGGTGEIDLMEALGTGSNTDEADKIHQTLHYDYSGTHPKVTTVPDLPGFDPTQFHTYGIAWDAASLRWTVDGRVTMSLDQETTPWLAEVLGKPYFLRINLAVGGTWPGSPTAATTFPASLDVDWVRVYDQRQ